MQKAALALVVCFVAALAVRLHHIRDPLLDFHPTRQYRSAMIARALYVPFANPPEYAREAAVANADQGFFEPAIIERLAFMGYWITGAERLWIGRLISIAAWLIGAAALLLLMQRFTTTAGSILGTVAFLFAPFGTIASRSFQPDALMTASIVIAVLQSVRLREQPTPSRWIAAVLATGWAAFVKPMSVFFTVPCAVVLQLAATDTRTWKQMFGAGRKLLAFVVLAAVPSAVHYLRGMALGAFEGETRGRLFLLHLLATEFFWQGWWRQLVTVAPAWTWILTTLAPFVAAPGIPKQVVTGLSIGYLLFVASFPYHAATHDYYHLPALVIVALALAVLAPRLQRVARPPRTLRVLLAGAVVVLAVVWLQQSLEEIRRRDRSGEVEIYERIGALVSHSRRTVLLAYDYGAPLTYHGHFAGRAWPSRDDLFASSVGAGSGGGQGAWSSDVPNAQQRFEEFYLPHTPEYFIITDFDSFDAQPDLQQFLDSNFRQMVADDAFTIYDLRGEVATR